MNREPILNIAAYRFVSLDLLSERREQLRLRGEFWNLKGTILLSPEGINLFLAGTREGIDGFLTELRTDPIFADLEVKESFSETIPFEEFFVKLKKEIIPFGQPEIDAVLESGPRIDPHELKRWLDEGRDFTLLDTRNDYEIDFGTFERATTLKLKHFREFPEAIEQLPEMSKMKPVVMFCTGGIRCEKASLLLQKRGFQVLQLEGGILKYFEEVGGDHYRGECFVFDQRVALDSELRETRDKRGFDSGGVSNDDA
jgi:predicted sulfurtransferase